MTNTGRPVAAAPGERPVHAASSGCATCGHPVALHCNGTEPCRAFACTAGPGGQPCQAFEARELATAAARLAS
jgi:hypothetical protein